MLAFPSLNRATRFAPCGLVPFLLLAFASCSSDNDKLPDVSLVEPATGGSGTGAGAASGGGLGRIGDRCTADSGCASGFCLRADDPEAVLTTGTAPGGLCSAPCEGNTDCRALDDESTCVLFGAEAYCVQTCRFGNPAIGDDKCAQRAELSCQPLLVEGGPDCDALSPCPAPYECLAGSCSILPACLPRCNGDFDCPTDRYCDPRFGECVTEQPEGKGPGETCDPEAEVDECRGTCFRFGDVAECEENCTVGAPGGCGYPDARTAPVVCAFFTYDIGDQGVLDEGSCASRCRCNDECPGTQLCLPDQEDPDVGVCVSGIDEGDSLRTCPAD